MCVGTLAVAPLGIAEGRASCCRSKSLALGAHVGLLSSVIPYSFEVEALRRIAPPVFGVLMSLEPGVAAIAGFLIVGQPITLELLDRDRLRRGGLGRGDALGPRGGCPLRCRRPAPCFRPARAGAARAGRRRDGGAAPGADPGGSRAARGSERSSGRRRSAAQPLRVPSADQVVDPIEERLELSAWSCSLLLVGALEGGPRGEGVQCQAAVSLRASSGPSRPRAPRSCSASRLVPAAAMTVRRAAICSV